MNTVTAASNKLSKNAWESVQYQVSILVVVHVLSTCYIIHACTGCECVYSTNSSEGSCETLGGQCSCLADYLGKNCDLCPINYFSEGPEGCTCK